MTGIMEFLLFTKRSSVLSNNYFGLSVKLYKNTLWAKRDLEFYVPDEHLRITVASCVCYCYTFVHFEGF